jgi:hypothetical protein
MAFTLLFRLSHKRTYFFWPVCCRVLFRLHQVCFFSVCHCFFRLFFFLHGRVRVVVATWATLVGCSCSTSMLSYALLACLLAIVLPSFFSCYCKNNGVCFLLSMLCSLSLFFFHCFWYFFIRALTLFFPGFCCRYFLCSVRIPFPPSSSLLCMWSGFTVYLTLWTTTISFAWLCWHHFVR